MVSNTRFGLRSFRRSQFVPVEVLADLLGVNKSTLYRYELPIAHPGHRIPPREAMRRIWVWSKGAVGPQSFYDLPELEELNG